MYLFDLWQGWRKFRAEWRSRRDNDAYTEAVLFASNERAADGCRRWRRYMRWRREDVVAARRRIFLDRACGDTRDAERTCRRWIRKAKDPRMRRWFVKELVELAVFHYRRDLMPEADAWTAELLHDATATARIPEWKAYRGAVLVELGRVDEALPYLHEVMEETEGCAAKYVAAWYLAKLHHDRGDTTLTREWLAVAPTHRLHSANGRLPLDVLFVSMDSPT